ncbi:hypothetical protein OA335_00675 [Prochlorococcus sp. AH-716-M18]|nr:hypothetical protein [Prochlorococcus sp. AH-716-M18]
MLFTFKKLAFITLYNSCLFLMLIIGIQNSPNKSKVNLLINETVSLPISFIIGVSFISGSLLGNIFFINDEIKKIDS